MSQYLKYGKSNYDKYPSYQIRDSKTKILDSYQTITQEINAKIKSINKPNIIIAFDFYYGVNLEEIKTNIIDKINYTQLINTSDYKKSETETKAWLQYWLTDDRIFGHMSNLDLALYFNQEKMLKITNEITKQTGVTLIYNVGASLFANCDLIVYFDMPRWEIQQRQRKGQDNWDAKNFADDAKIKYKRSYFIEWRSMDSHKQNIFKKIDYWCDTTIAKQPRMLAGETYRQGLQQLTKTPFRVVPFFDPGVWGGQWMKQVMDLDPTKINYAWCFDFVVEENSLCFKIDNKTIETPAINTVLYQAEAFLGEQVYSRFGAEWPIRSDLLDCMEGQNLSLHVHPLTQYMSKKFGLNYTQDESYYILDGQDNQSVYLGFKDNVQAQDLKLALDAAHYDNKEFVAEQFFNKFASQNHQHYMIPAGTPHCAGKDTMVLEISATPYIFTLRLWDWGRVDFDGKPRNIYVNEALENAQFNFDEKYSKKHLIPEPVLIKQDNEMVEEKTGLHAREFIETRRFSFKNRLTTKTNGNFNLIHLVEGPEIVIKALNNEFEPFTLHYAEVAAIPAQITEYQIIAGSVPYQGSYQVLKSYVRF